MSYQVYCGNKTDSIRQAPQLASRSRYPRPYVGGLDRRVVADCSRRQLQRTSCADSLAVHILQLVLSHRVFDDVILRSLLAHDTALLAYVSGYQRTSLQDGRHDVDVIEVVRPEIGRADSAHRKRHVVVDARRRRGMRRRHSSGQRTDVGSDQV